MSRIDVRRRVLALVAAICVAFGSVPIEAAAEAVDAVRGLGEEQVLADASILEERGDLASGEHTSSEAVVDTSDGQPLSNGEGLKDEDATTNEEPVPSEGTAAHEEAVPSEEGVYAPGEENQATDDEIADGAGPAGSLTGDPALDAPASGEAMPKDADDAEKAPEGQAKTTPEVAEPEEAEGDGPLASQAQVTSFADVPADHWAHGVIVRAVRLDLFSGYADEREGLFGPDDNISRAQVAVVLWRMAGRPRAGSAAKSFADVPADAYCYEAVRWASSVGIISGYSGNRAGSFGPWEPATREQLAAMLANYARRVAHLDTSGSTISYAAMSDAPSVSSWASSAVGWCFACGILSGSAGRVLPSQNATRAQAAKMLVKLYDRVAMPWQLGVSASAEAVRKGDVVSWSPAVSGSAGKLTYTYLIVLGSWSGTVGTGKRALSKTGCYQLTIVARDAQGRSQTAATSVFSYELTNVKATYTKGTSYRVAGSVGCGEAVVPGVEYRFTWSAGGTSGQVRGWGSSPVCAFDAKAIGKEATSCTITVEARDAKGSLGKKACTLGKGALCEARIQMYLDGMSTEQKVAQLFVVRPEELMGTESTVTAPSSALKQAMQRRCVGGVILMGANLQYPAQTRSLLQALKSYGVAEVGLAPLLCVDEEGGTVARIAGNSAFGVANAGDMSAVGATGDVAYAEREAKRMGTYLRDLGFTVDFAPVADISAGPGNFIQWRSFGTDAGLVSNMVAAQVRGFSSAGILCTAKHFPGIGAAEGDSHFQHIYSYANSQQLKNWELKPFAAAIGAGVPLIMVGHLNCVGFDGGAVPSSLSRDVVTGLLRQYLHYDGLVITDALGMGAVTDVASSYDVGVRVIEAGCDLILAPVDFNASYQGMLDAVRSGRISQARLEESVRRVIRAKLSVA